jgi:hypothetical protein
MVIGTSNSLKSTLNRLVWDHGKWHNEGNTHYSDEDTQ